METISQTEIRQHSCDRLRELGINPYPAESFFVNSTTVKILNEFAQNEQRVEVNIAGRLMNIKRMGKACFAVLQDSYGRIQLYIKRDDVINGSHGETMFDEIWKNILDIGDIIGVQGYVFRTKTGEISIHVTDCRLLSKSMQPLPVVKEKDGEIFDAFTNPELRYRKRHVDLIVNPEIRNVFRTRTQIVNNMRSYLNDFGFLEVETPILQNMYGGAAARPFKTYHNTLNTDMYLRIANELYLKRLIIGGFDGVYEFAKDFRNEGMSRFHNPEFTQMELYVAYRDYYWMMDYVESMIRLIATSINPSGIINCGNNTIDFSSSWRRMTMYDSILEYADIDISGMNEDDLRNVCKAQLNIELKNWMNIGNIIDEIFSRCVEPRLINPTIIMDYPVEMSPLAKRHRNNSNLTERFEVICNGKEICNAYSELNDPVEQRQRFIEQLQNSNRGDSEAMQLDEDFLDALSYGMPPTAGLGIGIDRLTMILTNSNSIQDVLFFPQMKNKND